MALSTALTDYAKGILAAISLAATAVLGIAAPGTELWAILTAVVALIGAILVVRVPNTTAAAPVAATGKHESPVVPPD